MNYPKPNTFSSITVKPAPAYLSVPGYKFAVTLLDGGIGTDVWTYRSAFTNVPIIGSSLGDIADATPAENSVTSRPYIITITNYSSADVRSVNILGAFQNQMAINHGLPDGIEIKIGDANISYGDFLLQIQRQPFTVGHFYLTSSNIRQVLQPLRLKTMTAYGFNERILHAELDPYAHVSTVTQYRVPVTIDGNITYEIDMLASTELKLFLFPTRRINNNRTGLARGSIIEPFTAAPAIITRIMS